jgi:RNA polymerase sigma-32 factor
MTTMEPASFSSYRAEVSRRSSLSRETESALAARYRTGDRTAARGLIEGCLSTVISVAVEYRRCGLPLEDLVQEGNIGLLKAVERFDPSRGPRLATYAVYWIRAEIREYVERHYRVVRLGRSRAERRALWLYRKTREQEPEALAAMSGLSTERATTLLPLLAGQDVSLSPSNDDAPSLLDRLADRGGSAEAELGDAEERVRLREAVAEAVAELSVREQDIVRRRLLAEDPETLEQLGQVWGVSKERVRQIEEHAKTRIRTRLADFGPPARKRAG